MAQVEDLSLVKCQPKQPGNLAQHDLKATTTPPRAAAIVFPDPTRSMAFPPAPTPSYLIISGGTGANSIASAFGPDAAYVLPVSDDGGSSSEILRCFGGPSIGDIRELCVGWGGEAEAEEV